MYCQLYGSLGHGALTSVDLDSFVANDNAHELNAIMVGLSATRYDVKSCSLARASSPLPGNDDEADDNQSKGTFKVDDMDFSPKTRASRIMPKKPLIATMPFDVTRASHQPLNPSS
jgi:hypothetical protein